jgi:hypothetical protein
MERNEERQALRERFLIALVEATYPLQQEAQDREVALEVLIEAADLLKDRLEKELEEFRLEAAD